MPISPTPLLLAITLGVAAASCYAAGASAQEPARTATAVTPAPASAAHGPGTSTKQADATSATEPASKQFAVSINPLNLLIGRYGVNLEYAPVLHHALIVTPHYDYLSGGVGTDGCTLECVHTLNGGGVELGYRLYSGVHGFDGFFVGPSLTIARHKLTYADTGTPDQHSTSFTGIGGAIDVGWQKQFEHVIIGGGVGVQVKKPPDRAFGVGEDLFIAMNVDGPVLPRFAFNLGYAF